MSKQTLLIIIDTLKKGGAEVLLVGILPELNKRYHVVLVTLTDESDFKEDQLVFQQKYNLGFTGKFSLISCIMKLKRIISRHKPVVIHAHLFYSSLIARMACPASIPLLYSVHNELSKDIFNISRLLTVIEKSTIRNNHSIVAVSKLVFDDYVKAIGETKKSFILKNYITDQYFQHPSPQKDHNSFDTLKMVAVGNLKHSKNYEYLLQSFIHLKGKPVSLHIYGNSKAHPLYPAMQSIIDNNQLPIVFKGSADNLPELFPQYDLYVLSSRYEGFGIAVVEAMAKGLPALLSDLRVLREVSVNNALFFDIADPMALATLIDEILNHKHNLNEYANKGTEIARLYTKEIYVNELFAIYDKVLAQ